VLLSHLWVYFCIRVSNCIKEEMVGKIIKYWTYRNLQRNYFQGGYVCSNVFLHSHFIFISRIFYFDYFMCESLFPSQVRYFHWSKYDTHLSFYNRHITGMIQFFLYFQGILATLFCKFAYGFFNTYSISHHWQWLKSAEMVETVHAFTCSDITVGTTPAAQCIHHLVSTGEVLNKATLSY
jgi:hypothetical protein